MSFDTMKLKELQTVADEFGVDTEGLRSKKQVIAALLDEGVTFEEFERVQNLEAVEEPIVLEAPVPVHVAAQPPSSDELLVKMDRSNFRFEAYGAVFTKEHPFAVVPVETANAIFRSFEGFRVANPMELEEYYS